MSSVGAALLSSLARKRHVPVKGWKLLTSKEVPKLNKGKGAMKSGFMDAKGRFWVVGSMRPQYKVPSDLAAFKLKPYVEARQSNPSGS